ncbi:MAG: hypothetical protein JRH16_11205 [Deltaproteobacteria bacterium]|nr:hypothetical protein [Deltaproteobacteria bacterium]MBW2359937.1 hypothetical protein [Deltaproteobacteria bacterium]
MHSSARVVVSLIASVSILLLAGASAADCSLSSEYRTMHGSVELVDGGRLTLVQRGGDRVEFRRASGVVVMGAKTEWAALATGDHAIVGWRISDSPAVAHEVCVLPDS